MKWSFAGGFRSQNEVGTNHGSEMERMSNGFAPFAPQSVQDAWRWMRPDLVCKDAVRLPNGLRTSAWFGIHSADLIAIRDYCRSRPFPPPWANRKCAASVSFAGGKGVAHLQLSQSGDRWSVDADAGLAQASTCFRQADIPR